MITGEVKFYKSDSGYGFIVRDDGEGDVFFHIKQLRTTGLESLESGEKVSFEVEQTERGSRAVNVNKIS